jgi:hypothetical protein
MQRLLPVLTFGLGLVLGGLAASHVWLVALRALDGAVLAVYLNEQELLASRAHRNGDAFRDALHRVNVADGQAGIGFRWLERQRNASYLEKLSFPWSNFWYLQWPIIRPDDPRLERGHEMLEAQYRADAAIALERVGASAAAAQEWARARELQPSWSIERFREHENNTKPFDIGFESAHLDARTGQELASMLAERED